MINKLTTVLFVFLLQIPLFASIKLPALFSDNMILQQQSNVAIWGWADKEEVLTVSVSWNNKQYNTKVSKDGKWKVIVETGKAGGPFEITIEGNDKIKISNVLLGEVWLCSGQSNMEMPMAGFRGQPVEGSNMDILRSKNKNIRLISVPRASETELKEDFTGSWQEANSASVAWFSATAYYYGRLLNEILDVPVGLIDVTWGGSCVQAWMSENTAIPFENNKIPKPGDKIKDLNRTPTTLFNAMVNPVIGYGIKGCIWYQGETNFQEPEKYKWLFSTMVNEWRSLWEIGEFPFYYVQIAPFNYAQFVPSTNNPKFNSAYLREAQLKAQDTIPNSGMVVLLDAGENSNIHPRNKKVVGERLAYWALGKTYKIDGVSYQSPAYQSMEIKDSTIIVSFSQFNGITSYGKDVTLFEIAGEDKVFYPANVVVRSKSVIVSSPKVTNPVAVRYGFRDYVKGELFGADGLPVSSFRTDDWDVLVK